jgi:thiol:disulfide interchange protein DsbD
MIRIWNMNNRARILFIFAALIFTSLFTFNPSNIHAQPDTSKPDVKASESPVTVEAFTSHSKIVPGGTVYVALRLTVESGWHINSNKPYDEYLIPTSVELADSSAAQLVKIDYPEGKPIKFAFSPTEPLSVYDKISWIKLQLALNKNRTSGAIAVPIEVATQACNDRSCVAPTTQTLNIPLEIDPTASATDIHHRDLFESMGFLTSSTQPSTPSVVVNLDQQQTSSGGFWSSLKNFRADTFVKNHGYILAFIAMYLLGFGLTLTPCVYPIIPITIGYFGSQSSGKWTRQLAMASVFGLGIALSYATVGTIAALTGSIFGAALQSKWVLMGLSAVCLVMALNAFGLYEFQLPGWLSGLAGGGSRSGIAGAGLMGLTMGIAAAPCLAAFIVSLLAFVGQKGDPVLGFSMFLILGFGLATPFIILGTFSGMISKVPKSGGWLVYAKKVMGALLIGAALYFLNPVLPGTIHHTLVMIALVAGAMYFGIFEPSKGRTWKFSAVRYVIGVVLLASAIWWDIPAKGAGGTETTGIAWQTYSETLLQQAKANTQPVIIDFGANWCIPCKELDKNSFSDPRVIAASKNYVMMKVDLTEMGSPISRDLIKRFGIKGVPTVVFLGANGEENSALRIMHYEPPDDVLSRFNSLPSAGKKATAATNSGISF